MQCRDRKNGFVECKVNDVFDKMTSRLSYDVFMRLFNLAHINAEKKFYSELSDTFSQLMIRYCLDNKDTIIEHIPREITPQNLYKNTTYNEKQNVTKTKINKTKKGGNE